MAEDTTTTDEGAATATDSTEAATETQQPAELGDAGKQAIDRMKAERDEARRQAKAHERELVQFRTASMSEAERAVAEAEARGRTAAATEFGKRLARTEFDAAAARRNPGFDMAGAVKFIDLARFVGDDGEPDRKAIAQAVEQFVPTGTATTTAVTFDGGARQTAAKSASMSDIIRGARRGG